MKTGVTTSMNKRPLAVQAVPGCGKGREEIEKLDWSIQIKDTKFMVCDISRNFIGMCLVVVVCN